tara:strand:+ start:383 stop:526 length:144 start_codon:yes stop_codon:yes gene_type:complete
MKTLNDLTATQIQQLYNLTEIRNNFYNIGNIEKYNLVQKDMDLLMAK